MAKLDFFDDLDAKLREVQELPALVVDEVVALCATELKATHDAQKDPYGNDWPERTSGKPGPMFVPFEKRVGVSKIGNVVYMRVIGRHNALHHLGHARKAPQRKMIPTDGKIPPAWIPKIRAIIERKVREITEGT